MLYVVNVMKYVYANYKVEIYLMKHLKHRSGFQTNIGRGFILMYQTMQHWLRITLKMSYLVYIFITQTLRHATSDFVIYVVKF